MKIIDMLNKMANGEKTPRYITYYNINKSEVETILNCEENIIHKLEHNEIRLNSRIEPGDKSITTFNLISFNNDYPDAFKLLNDLQEQINDLRNKIIELGDK